VEIIFGETTISDPEHIIVLVRTLNTKMIMQAEEKKAKDEE
jgi:hypothetical protein